MPVVLRVHGWELFRDVLPTGEPITVVRYHTDAGLVDAPMLSADADGLAMAILGVQ